MPHKKRKHRTPPGTRLGTHKDKTKTRMEQRAKDKRVQESLSEVADAQRRLDARMAAEEAQAAALDTQRLAPSAGILFAEQHAREMATLRDNITKRNMWPLADARHLIRSGYSLESTVQRTGWPAEMLADVQAGEW